MRHVAVGVCLALGVLSCGSRASLEYEELPDGSLGAGGASNEAIVIGVERPVSRARASQGPEPSGAPGATTANAAQSHSSDTAPRFALKFVGVGFEAYESQIAHLMLVREFDDTAVAMGRRQIHQGMFAAQWADVLEPGAAYRMDLFVGEGATYECHKPPDHAWRALVPRASGDVVVFSSHTDVESSEACDMFKSSGILP